MKILYLLGKGSEHDNAEFRWSLRSLEKHAKDPYGECNVEVLVVGDAPDWFNGPVMPVEDLSVRKQYNMAHKLIAACRERFVEGEFMMSADDHFLTNDIDFDRAPQYWKNPILSVMKDGGNNFNRGIELARNVLLLSGMPAMDFSHHFNSYFFAEDWERVDSLMKQASNMKYGEVGANVHSLFGNCWLVRNCTRKDPRPLFWRKDQKYPDDMSESLMKPGEAEKILGFSISDKAFGKEGFVDWMNGRYKEKSRWEK